MDAVPAGCGVKKLCGCVVMRERIEGGCAERMGALLAIVAGRSWTMNRSLGNADARAMVELQVEPPT